MYEKKGKILIVDDIPANIRFLVEHLRNEYAIQIAKNGLDALKFARIHPQPDIILLDVLMPGMDGYEVCRRLKEDNETNDIPVFFITGQSDDEDEAKGLALGAVDYISKPFSPGLVKKRVENQFELKRHRDSLDDLVHDRTAELLLTRQVTIEALASLAEWRDPETGAHVQRTKEYVRVIAEYMSTFPEYRNILTKSMIDLFYISAPLHDVGKVSVPDSILRKPGKLTYEEYEEMKLHTTHGRDALASAEAMLGDNSFLHTASEIACSHHERWDGMGYPYGLAGEKIPLAARIMAVADVYDALASKRVYKEAMSYHEAALIVCQGRGTQFDPHVVDAFTFLKEDFITISESYKDQAV